ncbi:hypothetical protein ACJIZ3_016395 [Penstemon smallii]|uniref:RING-H2 finger protein ATL21A n=1 Tax=Penstemon smallii TaxID=265156 RepID=A0ABD3RQ99_9LAMI
MKNTTLTTIPFAFFFFFLSIHARIDCPKRFCGDNPFVIRFPFQLENQKPKNCGYPGFNLSCSLNQKAKPVLLNLESSGAFYVGEINYLNQEIQLYDPYNCLISRLMSLNLSSTPFMASYTKNFTFLSCPSELIRDGTATTIDCLSNTTTSILATSSMNLVRDLDMNICSTMFILPIPVSKIVYQNDDDQWLDSNLTGDLRLTWNVPDCKDCESKGGICGFDENSKSKQLVCFDDHGKGRTGILIIIMVSLAFAAPLIAFCIGLSCYIYMLATRLSRRAASSPSTELQAHTIDISIIDSYIKIVVGESRRLPGPNGATCPICLADYHPKDTLICVPPCQHCFHSVALSENQCPNSYCGAVQIRYPFKLESQQFQNCECTNLSCNNQGIPILNLPFSGDFHIRYIDYDSSTIVLYDPNNCLPKRLMNLMVPSPFVAKDYQNYTFYNCPPKVAKLNLTAIHCLSNSTNTVVLATSNQDIETSYGCSVITTSQIPVSWFNSYNFHGNFDDLMLTWCVPLCKDCYNQEKGGRVLKMISRLFAFVLMIPIILIVLMVLFVCITCLIRMAEKCSRETEIDVLVVARTNSQSNTPDMTAVQSSLDDSKIENCSEMAAASELVLLDESLYNGTVSYCSICLEHALKKKKNVVGRMYLKEWSTLGRAWLHVLAKYLHISIHVLEVPILTSPGQEPGLIQVLNFYTRRLLLDFIDSSTAVFSSSEPLPEGPWSGDSVPSFPPVTEPELLSSSLLESE